MERLPSAPGRHAIERGVVLPVLQALGWDVFDTREVVPRFKVGRASADLALARPRRVERAAARVAGLEFGKDVIVPFGETEG